MQNVIDARKRLVAGIDIADIAFVKYKISPFFGPDCFPDFVQIVLMPGREIIEAHHFLTHEQQGLKQIRADETGTACEQPCLGRSEERRVGKECGSTCRYWWTPYH